MANTSLKFCSNKFSLSFTMACSAIDLERHIKWSATKSALDLLINFGAFEYQEPIVDDEWVVKAERVNGSQIETTLFQVYPNPAENILIIETMHAGISHIAVYDALGKMVLSENVTDLAFQHAVILSELSTGFYNLRLTDKEGNTVHHQSIVKK